MGLDGKESFKTRKDRINGQCYGETSLFKTIQFIIFFNESQDQFCLILIQFALFCTD